jgi:hypothetical protein
MNERILVYLFRDGHFAPRGDTVVSVAARDAVVAVHGGGGVMDGDGLSKAFGGSCAFRNDDSGALFIGVWGERNASRFRNGLRAGGLALEIMHERPPARLVVSSTTGTRPARHRAQQPENPADVLVR